MFASAQLVALALFAAASSVRADVPADCARTYTVQAGDTCDGISASQSVSSFQLAHVNPDINAGCSNLALGTELCLGITGEDCTTVQVVKSGDYCALIAGDVGIPLATLLANNPNVNSGCTNLGVGEVLCTDSTIFHYT